MSKMTHDQQLMIQLTVNILFTTSNLLLIYKSYDIKKLMKHYNYIKLKLFQISYFKINI
jgi:hypothetical protein